jgi:phosphoserine aminotransferase
MNKPKVKPNNPFFSSGPCAKNPDWEITKLDISALARSHRAKGPKSMIEKSINLTADLLEIPDDYRIAIVPASDTGAFELTMWTMLGYCGVDILAWESFGKGWVGDVVKELKLEDIRIFEAEYGDLPDLNLIDFNRDVVFTLNGTTSGVRVPNLDWIESQRNGLTLCDATSGIFAQSIDWSKLDVTTFSWQKVLGGEAQHGMIILSPRAIERLNSYNPPWPVPKLFRLKKSGKVDEQIFKGSTINTPSLLCVADYLNALDWVVRIGGLRALIDRADSNSRIISEWVEKTPWIKFLAKDKDNRSNTSVCLEFCNFGEVLEEKVDTTLFAKSITLLLESENVAYDIGSYRDAPPGLRIWCGSTIEKNDIEMLIPWIEWAYSITIDDFKN